MSPPIQRPQPASQALLGQAETGEEREGPLVMSDSSLGPSMWDLAGTSPSPTALVEHAASSTHRPVPGPSCLEMGTKGCLSPVVYSDLSPVPHTPPAVLSLEAQCRGCTFLLPSQPSVHLPLPPAKNVGSSLHTEDNKKKERDQREPE